MEGGRRERGGRRVGGRKERGKGEQRTVILVIKIKHLTKKVFSCSYQWPIRCLYNLVS